MNDQVNKIELEQKARKIDEIYKNALAKIKQLGAQAISLLRKERWVREQKKIMDLSEKLKE